MLSKKYVLMVTLCSLYSSLLAVNKEVGLPFLRAVKKAEREIEALDQKYAFLFDHDVQKTRAALKEIVSIPNIYWQQASSPSDIYLLDAIAAHNIPAVKVILERGANPNCFDGFGMTPLILAIMNIGNAKKLELITVLLSAGANPNLADSHSGTPLHAAIKAFNIEESICTSSMSTQLGLEVIEKLVSSGARVKIAALDKKGEHGLGKTPLSYVRPGVHAQAIVFYLLTHVYSEDITQHRGQNISTIIDVMTSRSQLLMALTPLDGSVTAPTDEGGQDLHSMFRLDTFKEIYESNIAANVRQAKRAWLRSKL